MRALVDRWIQRLSFWLAYARNRAPWDTNQTPPEVVEAIAGPSPLQPGVALDIGCGTGTNAVYLAQHGWQAVGVDFVPLAIQRARARAARAGVDARFVQGDVLDLPRLPVGGPFDFALDIGCFHNLGAEAQARYAENLAALLRPGGTYMLYTFAPVALRWRTVGVRPEDVELLFERRFTIVRVERGTTRRGDPSAWFTMRRRGSAA